MHDNTSKIFPRDDASQAYNFGDALHTATSKGLALKDVLTSVADTDPKNYLEAAQTAREIAREYAAL